MGKIVIYQVYPRYFGNTRVDPVFDGTIEQNGCGKFNDFNQKALESIRDLGVSHIWFTGVLEHATKTDYSLYGIAKDHPAIVKGRAGSPYAVKDYYDVDPDLAVDPENRMQEFLDLLERCHQIGFKVIMDIVPNHVARQYKSDAAPEGVRDFGADDHVNQSFNPDNNFYYLPGQKFQPKVDRYAGSDKPYVEVPAKVTGNDCFTAYPDVNDWFDTVKLNYGVDYQGGGKPYFQNAPSTWQKMLDVLLFWTQKGIDGFRCDMAEMIPPEFWEWGIRRVRKVNPQVLFIAEIYQPDKYRDFIRLCGFDYLYDKVGMYDAVRFAVEGHGSASAITGCWQSVNGIHTKMLYFLENHDEQRIASDFFAADPINGFPGMVVLACMQTNPIMVYSGQELGESGMYKEGYSGLDGRSTIFDYWSIDSLMAWNNSGKWNERRLTAKQKSVRAFYKRLLNLCRNEKALSEGVFFDLMYANYDNFDFDSSKVFAFIRKFEKECLLVLANFASESRFTRLYVPRHAFDFLQIPDGNTWSATELLSNRELPLRLSSYESVPLELQANSGLLIKFVID